MLLTEINRVRNILWVGTTAVAFAGDDVGLTCLAVAVEA